MLEYVRGEPIPDLRKMPLDDWVAALAPLQAMNRQLAFQEARATLEERAIVCWELDMLDADRRQATERAIHAGGSPAEPTLRPRDAADRERSRRIGSRQLNFRLWPGEYTELAKVAASVGLKPTQLARQLVLNGMRRIRYEHRMLEERGGAAAGRGGAAAGRGRAGEGP